MKPPAPFSPIAAAIAAYEANRFAEAETICRKLLTADPRHGDALYLLGLSLAALGRAEAAGVLRQALTGRKQDPALWLALGNAEARADRGEAAADAYRAALRAQPTYVPAHVSLGRLHFDSGHFAEAASALRRALDLDRAGPFGRDASLWNQLGFALSRQNRISDAVAAYRQAIALDPKSDGALANLATALLERGEIEDAVAAYERALALAPRHADLRSNLLLALNYSSHFSRDDVWRRHRAWDENHGNVARIHGSTRRGSGESKHLRIGYVSADLRTHPVAQFLLPLLNGHRRDRVATVCYSTTVRPDEATARLRAAVDEWCDIGDLSDDEAAGRIASDGIDVLIDLNGHTAGNRLGVFARRPAPLQATWLGYPNTTGLSAIDLRITDAIADPPGEADALHSEKLLRLPGCFLCYGPPTDAPDVSPAPVTRNGFVTFGSFNNTMKVTPETVALWAEILGAVKDSRLLLKSPLFVDAGISRRYRELFASHGVAGDRLTLREAVREPRDHLALYSEIDIALDSFPYNGTTTTCEALWMGCPVVTLAGERHAGRVGASLLTAAGWPQLIATDPSDYVVIARDWAADRERLGTWRRTAREKLLASALCDGAAFAAGFEDGLRAALAARRPQA